MVTGEIYCVCELTDLMCAELWHISRKALLNSQNMKSVGLFIRLKERKA
jgi:hypothetical protein